MMKKRKNSIEKVVVGDEVIEEPSKIKQEVVNFYKEIFKEEHHNHPFFQDIKFNTLSPSKYQKLVEKFSEDEIDQAVASCDASKALGPDGFNFKFIKNSWDVIKLDVYDLVHEF